MRRLVRSLTSFVIVVAAYSVYAMAVVPFVEPVAVVKTPGPPRPGNTADDDPDRALLAHLFPQGSWELDSPIVLESDDFKLLVREYRTLPDGRVELRPCTIVLMPGESEGEAAIRAREAVVLQAPHGAVLTFDGPFNLSQGRVGRFVAGQLNGAITIRSQGKDPGPTDDLWLTTSDVRMSDQQVWTPQPVNFRWGPNHGRGQQMLLKLLRGDSGPSGAPNIRGIEVFEMAHVDRLHLELGGERPSATRASGAAPSPGGGFFRPRPDQPTNVPIEITCRGPFRCDMLQQVATFEDQVNVWRINPNGPADQLNCNLLSIEFRNRPRPDANGPTVENTAAAGQSFDLMAERIEATGNPLAIEAPSESLRARGQWLEYHVLLDRLELRGDAETFLVQGANEIHSPKLVYQAADRGRMGQVEAKGPGWLRAPTGDDDGRVLEARWSQLLEVRPFEKYQLVSLLGDARVEAQGLAQLSAKQIYLYLDERPSDKPGETKLRPNHMMARDQVHLDSEQVSGDVAQLEIWFEDAPAPITPVAMVTPSTPSPPGRLDRPDDPPWQPADVAARTATPMPMIGSAQPAAPSRQHFDVSGRLLRGLVLIDAKGRAELSELIIEQSVKLVETLTGQPDELPMLVMGDRLQVVNAMQRHAAVTVTGQPAHFEARGLGMTGSNINVNRGTNRMWIEGAGWMDLPIDRDMDGRRLAQPQSLRVDWQRQMEFDGKVAKFDETVIASTPTMRLRTEALEVEFQQRVDFAEPSGRPNADVEQVRCLRGVLLENHTYEQGAQTAFDRIQVADLMMNLRSGDLSAKGPGWVASVRRGITADPSLGLPAVAGSAPRPEPRNENALSGLVVRFQGSITGNLHRRAMQFNDQVGAAFAPVESWTTTLPTDRPEALGPEGVVMSCEQLAVNQLAVPMTDRRAMELVASGNTVVEGNAFTGRASRMTYAEAKDMLVFEGDGRNDAHLYRQLQVGGQWEHLAARKILYWPKTKTLQIDGARSLELSGLGMGSNLAKP